MFDDGVVIRRWSACVSGCDADELQDWMLRRIRDLALERIEATPQHVGFGRVEVAGQPVEPLPIFGVEVDLDGLRDPRASLFIMIIFHELMIH